MRDVFLRRPSKQAFDLGRQVGGRFLLSLISSKLTPAHFRTQRNPILEKLRQILEDGKMCFIYLVTSYSLAWTLTLFCF